MQIKFWYELSKLRIHDITFPGFPGTVFTINDKSLFVMTCEQFIFTQKIDPLLHDLHISGTQAKWILSFAQHLE